MEFRSVVRFALPLFALMSHLVSASILDANKLIPPMHGLFDFTTESINVAYFNQLKDHSNPALGTFRQRYFWSSKYYKGAGSPVVLWTPGEVALDGYDGYATNSSMPGQFAQAIGGAVVLLEHRYWGKSSPVATLNAETLQHLTLKNSIADLVHFARTANLPFDKLGTSQATKAPWVLTGGSYAGALAAWTESTANGTFWAYHASSAVVQTIFDFWQYFGPIRLGMPKSCAKDIELVVNHVDHVLHRGGKARIARLKSAFGLAGVLHSTDFANAIASPVFWQYGPNPSFCESMANGRGKSRLQKALSGYATYYKRYYAGRSCPPPRKHDQQNKNWCLNTYDKTSSLYTDNGVNNPWDKQWTWMLCNEPFAWWQVSAPKNHASLLSRHVTAAYVQRECSLYFPPHNGHTVGSSRGRKPGRVNAYTQGWKRRPSKRLMWANHELDPWRAATVSAKEHPGGPKKSTPNEPVRVTPGGYHCQDLIAPNPKDHSRLAVNTRKIMREQAAQMKRWVSEYPKMGLP